MTLRSLPVCSAENHWILCHMERGCAAGSRCTEGPFKRPDVECRAASHSAVSWGWKLGNYLPWRSDKGNVCGLEEEASGVEVRAAFDEWRSQECVKGCYSSTYRSQKVLCPVHNGGLPKKKWCKPLGWQFRSILLTQKRWMMPFYNLPLASRCITLYTGVTWNHGVLNEK